MNDIKNHNKDSIERISNGMEKENFESELPSKKDSSYAIPLSIVMAGAMLSIAFIYKVENNPAQTQVANNTSFENRTRQISADEEVVLPSGGVALPVIWGDLGSKLVSVGAIDADKFRALYDQREAFSYEYKNLLFGKTDGKLKITNENAGYLLNLFWALGLASKNPILESGEMTNPAYGGAGNFASTGGWTIAQGNAMNHYSRHKFFDLTPEQQALVDKVSRGIYRPCCGNSTHFPDCNHGMAMLGLLELM